MKNKIPHLILTGLLGSSIASQAAITVSVSDADFDPNAGQFGVASDGTLVRDANVVDGAGPQTLTYTVSGLTIDSDGIANDSVTISFSATASGNINSGVNNSNQGFFAVGSWIDAGEFTRMDFASISLGLSSGATGAAEFLGFTGVSVQLATNGETGDDGSTDKFTLNGTTYAHTPGAGEEAISSNIAINNDDFILLTGVETASGAGTNGGSYRHLDMDFSFSAVPEPSSTALLGLGGLVLALRRRKS